MSFKKIMYSIRGMKWAVFGYENYLKKRFEKIHGYPLNLEHPQTFSEKIQWIKIFGHLERYENFVDKHDVKNYVKDKVGAEYVIPTIGIYEKVKEIDYGALPNAFVIKVTHGCHWNIIVRDKNTINWNSVVQKIDDWLQLNYYYSSGETQYKQLKGRILIEKYIEDPSGDLKDFKFYCFHGEPRFIQVDGNRHDQHQRDIYDLSWNKMPMTLKVDNSFSQPVPKPEKFDEMTAIARKLAKAFPFVRVDLYCTGERVYFGELTFTPGAGMLRFTPRSYDYSMGELLDISSYNTEKL